MSAQRLDIELDAPSDQPTIEALYSWSDEVRERASELGVSPINVIARLLQQQSVFDAKSRGRKNKRRRRSVQRRRVGGQSVMMCGQCGLMFVAGSCPRCRTDPKDIAISLGNAPEQATARGSPTLSFRKPPLAEFSSATATIEAILTDSPNWVQKLIFRKFVYRQRDSKAAQNMRCTKDRYREQLDAAIEHVALQLALRNSAAV